MVYLPILLLIVVLPACHRRTNPETVETVTAESDRGSYKKGEAKVFNEDLDAFVLSQDSDLFASADEESVSFVLVDETTTAQDMPAIAFKNVYFDYDQHELRQDQTQALIYNKQKIQDAIKQGFYVMIEGHACTIAKSSAHNLHVSQKRADTLREYYIEQGIPADKLKTVGRGCEMPIVPFGDKAQQSPNRRTEMYLLKD